MDTEPHELETELTETEVVDGEDDFVPTAELVDHIRRPRNLGLLTYADVVTEAIGSCGDSIEMSIVVRDGRIIRIGYLPHGCAFTLACASAASTLAVDKSLAAARRDAHPMAIEAALGGLPEGHDHCASLASGAIEKAITEYITTANEPWKRLYR